MKPIHILAITTMLAVTMSATADPTCTSTRDENFNLHGTEHCQYSDGTKVSTEWKNGKRDGVQVWVCPDGTRHELRWSNDDPGGHPGTNPCKAAP